MAVTGIFSEWLDGREERRRQAERQKWEQERADSIEAERAKEAAMDAERGPLTSAEYRNFYQIYHEGRAFGTGCEPDRKNCGCLATWACCSGCQSDRRRFERELARRQAEQKAGRMSDAEVRGIIPRPKGDWVDELAGHAGS